MKLSALRETQALRRQIDAAYARISELEHSADAELFGKALRFLAKSKAVLAVDYAHRGSVSGNIEIDQHDLGKQFGNTSYHWRHEIEAPGYRFSLSGDDGEVTFSFGFIDPPRPREARDTIVNPLAAPLGVKLAAFSRFCEDRGLSVSVDPMRAIAAKHRADAAEVEATIALLAPG